MTALAYAPAALPAIPQAMTDDRRTYELRGPARFGGDLTLAFSEKATDENSADEAALVRLMEWSGSHDGQFALAYLAPDHECERVLATARDGAARLLVPLDDVSADAMHCGPTLVTVRDAHAVRRSLYEPTMWGAA